MKTKLIVNTANDELILSLYYKGKVFSKVNNAKMHHNETMLPLIDELLYENSLKIGDIEEFGVVIGPGSFTGVRVGIATIKAFRDALNAKAKSINNLDLLFKLANAQNPDIDTVAILGSFNSYFVAKLINGVVYKYPRNLTKEELVEISENKQIGMYKADENLNCFVVDFDANVLLECYEESADETLVPVYYQLSQAESEKLKRGEIKIDEATIQDLEEIQDLEKESILNNPLNENDIRSALTDELYKTFKITHNGDFAGFVIVQITDEVNIVSVAVKKEFRNLGLATRLIEYVEKFTKEKGLSVVSLEVSDKNITAYLLYKKLGFKQRRVRKKYYSDGTDAIEMFNELK